MVELTGQSANGSTVSTPPGFDQGSAALRTSQAVVALRVYEQECALDDARGTGVAAWIVRAEQSLHAAILEYEAVNAAA